MPIFLAFYRAPSRNNRAAIGQQHLAGFTPNAQAFALIMLDFDATTALIATLSNFMQLAYK